MAALTGLPPVAKAILASNASANSFPASQKLQAVTFPSISSFDDVAESSDQATVLLSGQVDEMLATAFGQLTDEYRQRRVIADQTYLCINPNFVIATIKTSPWLAPSVYRENVFDCDDYAHYLRLRISQFAQSKGYPHPFAVGVILTAEHAFNFCIMSPEQICIIDTQRRNRGLTADPDDFERFLELRPDNPILSIYI